MSTPQQPPWQSTRQQQYGAATPGSGSDATRGDGGDLKHSAHDLGEQAKAEGKDQVADARRTAADKVDTLADSAQAAAAQLRDDDIGHLSEYVSNLADSMTRLSSTLREKSGDEVLRDIGRLARENPALFVTGSVAVGFGLARFARASEKRRMRQDTEDIYSAREYPVPMADDSGVSRDTAAATGTVYTSAPGATGGSEARSTDSAGQSQPEGSSGSTRPEGTSGGIH